MKSLEPNTIPLHGRHIIEASAGTGKTYNITELYIRLLLGKELLPKNILVMTFTKDATQEIISRVEAKLRETLASIVDDGSLDIKIEDKKLTVSKGDENYKNLKRALLEVDEAAIFTIHGFCKKILSEQAFASGIEMDITMETDTFGILKKTVEQYFRKYINADKEKFELLRLQGWHTPEKFLDRDKLLNVVLSDYDILADTFEQESEKLISEKRQVFERLEKHQCFIFDNLVIKHKDKNKRIEEWEVIKGWALDSKFSLMPKEVPAFLNGNRYRGRTDIAEVFEEIKALKDKYLKINDVDEYKKQFYANKLLQKICLQIRKDFLKAKEQASTMDFNDLIAKLNESVKYSPELVNTLQAQYPVALIDEFQDTDAQQYEILDAIYPKLPRQSATATPSYKRGIDDLLLLMIGDPKQAIYGFRGGDIFTYLKAKESCDSQNQWSMDTNWRSTSAMISAYNRLFYKDDLSKEDAGKNVFGGDIDYQLVKPSSKVDEKLIDFKDNLDAINYFHYQVNDNDNAGSISTELSNYTANEVASLLERQVAKEKDIAILVESGSQATLIQDALKSKGLTAVYLSQRERVYQSIEATEILYLMEGLYEYDNRLALKKALSTSLLGGIAEKFVDYQADDTQVWADEIDNAKLLYSKWQKYGFMALIIEVIHTKMQLRQDNKHRVITNILHLAELIKVAENKYKHPNQLIKWYRQQIANNENNSEAELRLENDDNLIKIVTIHGSKGLEYPIVFVPFASKTNTTKFNTKSFNKYYDKSLAQTVYKLGKDAEIKKIVDNEIIDESKRLLYVAITRASQRCYIGAAKFDKTEKSALAQFVDYKEGDDWQDKLLAITNNPDNHSKLVDVKEHQYSTLRSLSGVEVQRGIDSSLQAKSISLANDNWQMLSFSKITRDTHQSIGLEKEDDELDDEIQETTKVAKSLDFRFTAKKGADIGNLLHNVLEYTDFSSGQIDDDILKMQFNRYKVVGDEDYNSLKRWLEECLVAPINQFVIPKRSLSLSKCDEESFQLDNYSKENFCLKDIASSKALKEPEFYFPIKNNELNKARLMQILAKYRQEEISELKYDKIFGMLHGFIDLLFEYNGKFFVADYKSNHLGDKLEDYNQQAMSDKNRASFYDLQYLIYTVALDKYLQQSLPNYNYDEHFGGVYYFYLRGLKDGFGVYQARPSKEIVEELKALFGESDV
jgi:exodeoxyribonuclease V beta subunit